jgi:antitoxin CptB
MDSTANKKRALYRALHRGTREMDWLLGKFARACLDEMSTDELAMFEGFMQLPEPQLQNWLTYGIGEDENVPEDTAVLIGKIRSFHGLCDEK